MGFSHFFKGLKDTYNFLCKLLGKWPLGNFNNNNPSFFYTPPGPPPLYPYTPPGTPPASRVYFPRNYSKLLVSTKNSGVCIACAQHMGVDRFAASKYLCGQTCAGKKLCARVLNLHKLSTNYIDQIKFILEHVFFVKYQHRWGRWAYTPRYTMIYHTIHINILNTHIYIIYIIFIYTHMIDLECIHVFYCIYIYTHTYKQQRYIGLLGSGRLADDPGGRPRWVTQKTFHI